MDPNNNQIEEIKNKLDIAQVVEKYVKLRQAGKNYQGLCPFHNEKTPSFIVSPDIQRYKCFGCGETGDIFNFLQKIENIDFPEALEKLALQAGVELKKKKVDSKYKTLEEINYNATKYFYNELKKNKVALQYLTDRGFTQDSIKAFGIGYAPRYPKLREYLLKIQKYTKRELEESGLFSVKENQLKEKFYDRIMFPIRSRKGTVLAFTGRVLPNNTWGPKYMNSPDTPIFHKKDNVFGQYESRQEIRKDNLVIMCEGSTDVISAHQHGIKNIVAPLGTALTTEQLNNLSTLSRNFLFFFDSDEAGKAALVRAFKMASELSLNPYATNAKPYKDIDELLQKDTVKMKELVKNKTEAFSFILSDYIEDKNINKLEDLNQVRDFIGSLLVSVKDETTKNHYIQKVLQITKIDLKNPEVKGFTPKTAVSRRNSFHVQDADNKLERKYLQLLLLLDEIKEEYFIPKEHIGTSNLLRIYDEIQQLKSTSKDELYKKLKENEEVNQTFESLIFDLTDIPTGIDETISELKIVKRRLEMVFYKSKQKQLSMKIAFAEENGKYEDSQKYLEEMLEINNILNKISNG